MSFNSRINLLLTMNESVPFNKAFVSGKEEKYIHKALMYGALSGNGYYTKKCQAYIENEFEINKCLLTTSCTDALEMTAILADVGPGDEVIIPSYTFVSTAIAFVRQGATLVFVDCKSCCPYLDLDKVEQAITSRTKVIVPVHYGGASCDMDRLMSIANKHQILVVEDAAQAIGATYKGRALGSIGHLGTYSFHETKNVSCGEGGALLINDMSFSRRAEIIWEKGTNRSEFFRGEVNKYGWVDTGSSFLPNELTAAFLYAQLQDYKQLNDNRLKLCRVYEKYLSPLAAQQKFCLPCIPDFNKVNGHVFYIVLPTESERTNLIAYLKKHHIHAVFHYLSLHKSDYFREQYKGDCLSQSDRYTSCLLRLPLFNDMTEEQVEAVCQSIHNFFNSN